MNESAVIVLVVFVAGSIPLVWQDVQSLTVSQNLLGAVATVWVLTAVATSTSWTGAVALSAGVLTVGAMYLLVSPESLGAADVVYMSAMAWLVPFWGFLLAVGLACLFGLGAFLWLFGLRNNHRQPFALPYLPCLALGGLAVLGSSL